MRTLKGPPWHRVARTLFVLWVLWQLEKLVAFLQWLARPLRLAQTWGYLPDMRTS